MRDCESSPAFYLFICVTTNFYILEKSSKKGINPTTIFEFLKNSSSFCENSTTFQQNPENSSKPTIPSAAFDF